MLLTCGLTTTRRGGVGEATLALCAALEQKRDRPSHYFLYFYYLYNFIKKKLFFFAFLFLEFHKPIILRESHTIVMREPCIMLQFVHGRMLIASIFKI